MITSGQNRQARFIIGLKKRKIREEAGCFFLEGLRAVDEAIRSGAAVRQIVVSESFLNSASFGKIKELYSSAYRKDVELVLLPVSDKLFAGMGDTMTPQGIGAVIDFPGTGLAETVSAGKITASSARYGLLVLENLQDPGNIGTIIRTAAAAGMAGILCTKGTVDIYNSKVLRSTAGAMFRLPVVQTGEDGPSLAAYLQRSGFQVCAAHPRGGTELFQQNFTWNTAIVIGNEAGGLTEKTLACCDFTVTIPMPGGAESLNASVAAALMIYELKRKAETDL